MGKPKLFSLLKALNREELVLFQKHLRDTRGKDSIVFQVFEYLKRFYPDFTDEKKLDIDYASQKIFRSPSVSEAGKRTNLQNSISDLYLILKKFITLEKAANDDFINRLLWIEALRDRGFKKEFAKEAASLYKDTVSIKERSSTNAYIPYMVATHTQFEQLCFNTRKPDIEGMHNCIEELKIYGEIVYLKMSSTLATAQRIRPEKSSPESEATEPIPIKTLPQAGLLLLEIYRDVFQLISTEEQSIYDRVERNLSEHLKDIHRNELIQIFTHLHNFLVHKLRTGGSESVWAEKLHQFHKFTLQQGLYDKKGALSAAQFLNIANVASTLKHFDWVNTFIHKYGRQFEENTVALANASVLFENGEFDKVLDLIHRTEFKLPFDQYRSKILVLRTYMETRFTYSVIIDYCLAFENVLSRAKPKTEAVQAILEFVRICKMILLMKTPAHVIRGRIRKKNNIYLREWLLKQINRYNI